MKKLLILLVISLCFINTRSQDLEDLLLSGSGDAAKLSESYLQPSIKGLMYSMNEGWTQTAKSHKLFGFDLTINASASMIPSKHQNFIFNPNDYEYITTANGETNIPTVMSENDIETTFNVSIPQGGNTYKVGSFELPGGIAKDLPLNAVPSPNIQVGFGLPFKTDVKVRFFPKTDFDEIEAGMFGLGLQHNISQYFFKDKETPLNIAVLGTFSNLEATYFIDQDAFTNVNTQNGEGEFTLKTFSIQAITSLDYKFGNFYGILGYNTGESDIKLKGDYNLSYDLVVNGINTGQVNETISNPLHLQFENSGIKATLGASLKLGFFRLFADYTFQEYSTLSTGISLTFDKKDKK